MKLQTAPWLDSISNPDVLHSPSVFLTDVAISILVLSKFLVLPTPYAGIKAYALLLCVDLWVVLNPRYMP